MKIFGLNLSHLKWKLGNWRVSFGRNPESDWKVIFYTTVSLLTVSTIMSIVVFILLDKREVFVVERPATTGSIALDINTLRKTNEYYQGKQVEFDRIKAGEGVAIVDPSL